MENDKFSQELWGVGNVSGLPGGVHIFNARHSHWSVHLRQTLLFKCFYSEVDFFEKLLWETYDAIPITFSYDAIPIIFSYDAILISLLKETSL